MECKNFADARNIEIDTEVAADLCIVGGGAAGITIAREFANSSIRVCLLEAGGLSGDLWAGCRASAPSSANRTSRCSTRIGRGTPSRCSIPQLRADTTRSTKAVIRLSGWRNSKQTHTTSNFWYRALAALSPVFAAAYAPCHPDRALAARAE
jgi:glycine/D-amino acid oxidase-like deaminating enzyme